MLTYGDLPASALQSGLFLYCASCDGRYSATRGDYFMCSDDEPVMCGPCDEPMILAREQTRIVDVLGLEV